MRKNRVRFKNASVLFSEAGGAGGGAASSGEDKAENNKTEENRTEDKKPEEEKPALSDTMSGQGRNELAGPTYSAIEDHPPEKDKKLPDKKKKRKKHIRRFIIAAVLIAVAAAFFLPGLLAGPTPVVVDTAIVDKADIDQTVTTTGVVESALTKTYYAGVGAKVSSVGAAAGDYVTEGMLLVAYDQDDLNAARRQAQLQLQEARGSYQSSVIANSEVAMKYGITSRQTAEAQSKMIQDVINTINEQILDKQRRMNRTLTDLQKTREDIDQNGILDNMEEDFDASAWEEEYYNIAMDSMELQHLLGGNDPEIAEWTRQIEDLTRLKAELDQDTAGMVNDASRSALSAGKEMTELNAGRTIESIDAAGDGIICDINGVVESVSVKEGQTVQDGMELMTVSGTDDVRVSIDVTKFDIAKVKEGQRADLTIAGKEYEGRIEKIAKNASKNERGGTVIGAEIKLLKPDEDLFLGVDADVTIHTAHADDAVAVPVEAVNTDVNGTFVYVLKDGTIERRDVETGISSDSYMEVLSGIAAGDEVITNVDATVTEGASAMSVTTADFITD